MQILWPLKFYSHYYLLNSKFFLWIYISISLIPMGVGLNTNIRYLTFFVNTNIVEIVLGEVSSSFSLGDGPHRRHVLHESSVNYPTLLAHRWNRIPTFSNAIHDKALHVYVCNLLWFSTAFSDGKLRPPFVGSCSGLWRRPSEHLSYGTFCVRVWLQTKTIRTGLETRSPE